MNSRTEISYAHMLRLSDEHGIFEHAKFTERRREHGYCLDDVARALVVAVRESESSTGLRSVTRTYLNFVANAQTRDGRFHNRFSTDLQWEDDPSLEDHWGRALWALGSVVGRVPELADEALALFVRSARRRSQWPRAMAFAALGAAEVARALPNNSEARGLLASAVALIGSPTDAAGWRWPEPRLEYANAALAEALLVAGSVLGDSRAYADGLTMLGWLLEIETTGDHISVTPVGGWVSGEPRPGFDQQPIEVAALADACATAFDLTGDGHWHDAVLRCERWFFGANDAGTQVFDPVSGGGCDGLERHGRNENQGAESTLAVLSTLQQARRIQLVRL